MKKTNCIQLVLITAALAGCDRPFFPQGPYYDPRDEPDSTNACPMIQSDLPPDYYLWYSGLQPDDFFNDWVDLWGYYTYHYPATIIRAGFGRTGGHGHS